MERLQDLSLANCKNMDGVLSFSAGEAENGVRAHDIPLNCSMERLSELLPLMKGINLDTCSRLDSISARTVNSDYRITLLDPKSGRALLEGGQRFPEPVEVTILGSSFGGSMLRMGWLNVGLRIEIYTDKHIVTSPIKSLALARDRSVAA